MPYIGDGGQLVAGPECRPTKYGLASVADVRQDDSEEWQRGIEWDQLACGYDLGVVKGQCNVEHHKTSLHGFGNEVSDPFGVYAGWDCSSGALPLGEAWSKAEELFNRNWWRSIERIFWTGLDQDDELIATTLGSTDVTDLTPAAGALDLVSGVASLESFAGDCFDCEPIIHGNRGMGTYFASNSLVQSDNDTLRMIGTGTPVAVGGGYLASGPDESAESGETLVGEAWLYVTGSVVVTHTSTFFTPDRDDYAGSVDRLVNDITVYAERVAAIQLGCCVGAVRVTLDSCCS